MTNRKAKAREVRERVARLRNKFRRLSRTERMREYVRYERAATGELTHALPTDYVNEVLMALEEHLLEEFGGDWHRMERWLDVVRRRPSRPF